MSGIRRRRITAFVGCARKRHTYRAVEQFLSDLRAHGDVDTEVVVISDFRLGVCRGCKVCFERGEALCPLNDDRDLLIGKMMASDGIVFATPNYSFQVSAVMKIFLERLGFVFHRPCFFGKTFTSIIVQGIYGGGKIERYLDFVGNGLGFDTVKGSVLTALEPMMPKEKEKQDRVLARQSERFYEDLAKPALRKASLLKLMVFRLGRTSMALELDDRSADLRYYRDHGWFESDFFYPVHLGVLKKVLGHFFDWLATRMARSRRVEIPRTKAIAAGQPLRG